MRTRRPLFRSKPGQLLWISTLLEGVGTLVLPYVPSVGPIFGFIPLPPLKLLLLLAITALYIAVNAVAKRWFYRRVQY